MKIRTKALTTIIVISFIIFMVLYMLSSFILTPSFTILDQQNNKQDIARAINTLNYRIEQVQSNVRDYAYWDDTYSFVQGNYPDYIDVNFVDSTFLNLGLNFVAIVDSTKQMVYYQSYDLNTSSNVETSIQTINALDPESLLWNLTLTNSGWSGLMEINNEPTLVATALVLTSNGEGPAMGVMMFGKYLDEIKVAELNQITDVNFNVQLFAKVQQQNKPLANSLLSNPNESIVEEKDSNTVTGYYLIDDVYSNPLLVLEALSQRTAYQQGLWVQTIFLGFSILLVLVVGGVVSFLLEINVIKPLKKLTLSVKSIPLNGKSIAKTNNLGSDELNIVSDAIKDTLDKKFEAMTDVSRMVAHDLRNPLNGIKGAIYVLKKGYSHKFDDKEKSMFKVIDDCVEYSNKIVTDLLDFSTETKLSKEKISSKKLVDSALSQFAIQKNINIVNKARENLSVLVDAGKMTRVFSNLIKNSFDAMPSGGELLISDRLDKDKVVLEVSDTGSGMSKQELEKLWTPFFTTKARGMGVGLPICKKIVEAHGGKIEVESAVNKGTTFRIYLPPD